MKSRFDYVKYDEKTAGDQALLKEKFIEVEKLIEQINSRGFAGHATSRAVDALEIAYMWTGKALRDRQIALNNKE